MNKFLPLKKLLLLSLTCLFLVSEAQIYAPEGLNMPGTWNAWTNPPTNNLAFASSTQVTDGRVVLIDVGTPRWQTIFQVAATGGDLEEGSYDFLFTSGPEATPFANKWAGVSVVINDLQEYIFQGTTDNNIALVNAWYTMVWEDAGYANTRAIFMETTNEPIDITSVSEPGTALPDEVINIDVVTSDLPSPEEIVYVRYTTNDWVDSYLVEATMTGLNGTAAIPGQPDGTTIDYYAMTSTVASITENYDLYTIKLNNNEGENYQCQVGVVVPAVIDWANLQYPESGVIMSGDAYDVYAQVHIEGITDEPGQGAGVQAWLGYSTEDTDPATWTNWIIADYHGDVGNNDEYLADLGAVLSDEGTYYYASRFQYLDQSFVYGGYSASGGGFWDGVTNVNGVLTITGTPPDPEIGWANLQYPESGTIQPQQEFNVFCQAWIENITGQVDPAPGLQAWIGYSLNDTDPAGWTEWIPADYFGAAASNDEFMADLGSQMVAPGTYYYASRFQYLSQDFVYGGYSVNGGGFWDGVDNVSGVLTVANEITTYPVTFTVTDATGLYTNIKFKGSMTNWEPVDMIQNGADWSVTLDIFPGTYEWGVFEDDGSPDGIWLIIGPNLEVTVGDDGSISGTSTYNITFVGVDEQFTSVKMYPNPTAEFLTINISELSGENLVNAYDYRGVRVMNQDLNSANSMIDMSSLSPGIYFIQVVSGSQQWTQKIVKY